MSFITKLRILGVQGSMKKNSQSKKMLELMIKETANYNADLKILDLSETILPLYNPDNKTQDNNEIRNVVELVGWADAFILASPDYHGSMSGSMKNFFDYFWKEFAGKLFAYVCSSHEKGLTVMDQMRTAVRQCYGWSMPYGISINPSVDLDANGNMINLKLEDRLKMMARDTVIYGILIRNQFIKDLNSKDVHNTYAARFRK